MGSDPRSPPKSLSTSYAPVVDRIDRDLLALLIGNGRSTVQELAEGIRLSPSATRERLRGLESAGYITGYAAVVDQARLGFAVDALVDVDLPPGTDEAAFAKSLAAMPAVVEALHATGEHDYLLRLTCRDIEELHRVVRGLKSQHGAARTLTRVVLAPTIGRRTRLS
jgi:Lrp/AsnC family transcriptional regulator, leucine-responsive regulatory protein